MPGIDDRQGGPGGLPPRPPQDPSGLPPRVAGQSDPQQFAVPAQSYPTDELPSRPAPYPSTDAPAEPSADPAPTPGAKPPTRRSRAGSAWVAFIVGSVVLIFLLVFVLQNGRSVEIHYFGWRGSLSLGVAMLFAAIGGALVAGLFSTVRILQLRARARKAGRDHL